MLYIRKLKAAIILAGLDTKDLAKGEGWSMPTAYRKVNGQVQWTAEEIGIAKDLLKLSGTEAEEIFFAPSVQFSKCSGENIQ